MSESASEWIWRVDTTSSDVRRRAKILLITLFVLNGSSLSVCLVALFFAPPGRKLPTVAAAFLLSFISYIAVRMTRKGWVDFAGILVSLSLSALIVLYQLYVGTYTGFLWFMILSVVIGSVSLRPKLIWVIGAVNIVLLVALGVLLPVDPAEKYRTSVMVGGLLLPLTVLTYYSAARVRETIMQQESTMEELERAKRELVDTNRLLELRVEERTADLGAKNERLKETLVHLRRTQGQLAQSEKMASLGMLVAGVGHELRNPLNFVNNFAEISLEYAKELDNAASAPGGHEACMALMSDVLPDLIDNLRRIHAHGRRAESIVSAMQLHGQTSDVLGSQDNHARTVEFNQLVHDHSTLAIHGFRARYPSLECEVREVLSERTTTIMTRPGDLSRVIVNLVDNACYAMLERVRQDPTHRPLLELRTRVESRDVVLEVKDNGAGIPQDVRRLVFDPFFTTKPPGEGTGLGLSISFDIVVKRLHGRLEVEPAPGGGSLFRVRLGSVMDDGTRSASDPAPQTPPSAPGHLHQERPA